MAFQIPSEAYSSSDAIVNPDSSAAWLPLCTIVLPLVLQEFPEHYKDKGLGVHISGQK